MNALPSHNRTIARWLSIILSSVVIVGFVSLGMATSDDEKSAEVPYTVPKEYTKVKEQTTPKNGRNVTELTVQFKVIPKDGAELDDRQFEVVLREEEFEIKRFPLDRAVIKDVLSVVFAMDTSGSMKGTRMDEAKPAAQLYFKELPGRAEAGFILFNNTVYKKLDLTTDRGPILDAIDKAEPKGGTAYLDACVDALSMLNEVQHKKKAIVVMTDGVDLNSKYDKHKVISWAKSRGVKIYTVGIGKAEKLKKVTSIMVLDQSGSMELPAEVGDKESKMIALQAAANEFVKTIRRSTDNLVRSSVLQFSDKVENPIQFTNNKDILSSVINQLVAQGETALYDATYAGIEALAAENPEGTRAVIVLTDGIDTSSRRRVEDDIIPLAKEENIRLYTLGFGPKGQLAEDVLVKMATHTGGKYYHANNKQDLMQIFENLSLELHDAGIDEVTLREMAEKTGGEYQRVEDIEKLKTTLKDVTIGLSAKSFTLTFESKFQANTGLARSISIAIVPTGKVVTVQDVVEKTGYFREGLMVAQADPLVYLGLLIVLGVLLGLPAGMSYFKKSAS